MIEFARRLLPLLDAPTRRRLAVATGAMLVLALLEGLALAALVPLLEMLSTPALHTTSATASALADLLGDPPPRDVAIALGAIVLALYVVKSLAAIGILRWTTTFALREEAVMARRVMRSYLAEPYVEHLRRNTAERVRTLTNSLALIFRAAFVQSFNAVGDLFSVVFVGVVLAVVDPVLALVSGGYFAAITYGYHRAARRVMDRAAYEVHVGQAVDLRTIQQPLAAVKEVKLRGAEEHFADDVYRVRTRLLPPHRVMALSSVLPRYVLELAMVGAAALIAAVAFTTQPTGTAAATVGVFLVGGFRMLAPLNKVIFGFTQARGALPSLDQVREDLEPRDEPVQRESAPARPGELQPRIRLRDVSFEFVPGVPVLEDVTLEIEPGDAVGFVGSSGAGKSTLVDVILGVLDPQHGEVLIGEWPIATVRSRWQHTIGYVPQSIVLFDDTVRANVALGCSPEEVDEEQLLHALSLAQLDDVVRSLANGLDQVIGEGGVQLSGGQRQRLGIARALYHDPKVLIFDEATSALDSETEYKLNQVLEGLRGRFTTITIAHRLSTVRRCDRLWYLDHGRVVAAGTFEDLDARIPGFARMVQLSRVDR